MKYLWASAVAAVIVLLAIAAFATAYRFTGRMMCGGCGGGCGQRGGCMQSRAQNGAPDALAWIRNDFRLDDAQIKRIEQMHGAFAVVCAGHCSEIRRARAALAEARAQNRPADEIAALETHIAQVDATCRASMTAYLQQVAAVIGGNEGRRFLETVLPRVAKYDHDTISAFDTGQPQPAAATTPHEH